MGTEVRLETRWGGSWLNKPGTYFIEDNQSKIFDMSLVGGPTIVTDHSDIDDPQSSEENFARVSSTNVAVQQVKMGTSLEVKEGTGGKLTITPLGPTIFD